MTRNTFHGDGDKGPFGLGKPDPQFTVTKPRPQAVFFHVRGRGGRTAWHGW